MAKPDDKPGDELEGEFEGIQEIPWMDVATCSRCGEPIKVGQVIGLDPKNKLITHEGPDLCHPPVDPAKAHPSMIKKARGRKGTPEQ